jgi:hypothetical protein
MQNSKDIPLTSNTLSLQVQENNDDAVAVFKQLMVLHDRKELEILITCRKTCDALHKFNAPSGEDINLRTEWLSYKGVLYIGNPLYIIQRLFVSLAKDTDKATRCASTLTDTQIKEIWDDVSVKRNELYQYLITINL